MGATPPQSSPDVLADSAADRLDSWKEIAAYLRRDIRTVQRWETRNELPVHRHGLAPVKGSPVHAYRSELDAWLRNPAHLADDNAGATAAMSATKTEPARLLVLPFVNLTGDADRDFLGDAITDETITALAVLSPEGFAVIARTTAMHYKGTRKDVGAIGRQVHADYVVEGAVCRDGQGTAVTVQLIRVADQVHLWASRFSGGADTVLTLPQTIARMIGEQLGAESTRLDRATDRAARRPTEDLDAYTYYWQGKHHWAQGTPQGFAAAKECFERAIARDSQFALAYDALAEMHWYLGFLGMAPAAALTSRGLFYAMRALDLDDGLAETHALVGLLRKEFDFRWDDVKHQMDRALRINPRSPVVTLRYAMGWLLPEGRLKEAIAALEWVLETDPLSTFARAWYSCMLWLDRQYDRAIAQGRRMTDIEPGNFLGYWVLGLVLRDSGALDDALAALRRALELSSGSPLIAGWLGLGLGQAGHADEARQLLGQLTAAAAGGTYVPPTSFAWTHLGLSDIDEAFAWMDRAVDGCDHMIVPVRHYPFLDGLRNDPRYVGLLEKLKYDPRGGVRLDA